MKKLITITAILGLFLGTNLYANNKTFAIKQAAAKGDWVEYKSNCKDENSLYFMKKVKLSDYHTYRYQNRNKHKKMNVYAKVKLSENGYNVDFSNKIAMNVGRLGTDSKMHNTITEFKKLIDNELASL